MSFEVEPTDIIPCFYSTHINSFKEKKNNPHSSKGELEPWFEFDTVPSQIEFPSQKIAVDIIIIDPAIW